MSTSACPAPTVSMMIRSKPALSKTVTKAAVLCARPPSAPRDAIERIKMPLSPDKSPMRIRSPSNAPPVKGLVGSTAMMATLGAGFPSSAWRKCLASWLTRVLFPVPGAPVTPIRCAVPVKGNSADCSSRLSGALFSTMVSARERASRSPWRMASGSTLGMISYRMGSGLGEYQQRQFVYRYRDHRRHLLPMQAG